MKDYYLILGLPRNATEAQIRQRFRDLARRRHPDLHHGADKAKAESDFQEITEALNVLVNAESRRRHDLELARPKQSEQGTDRKQVARVYLSRGVKAYREKNFLAAAESFDRATREDPGNAQAWHHLARACSHQRRWLSKAMEAIEEACRLEPMNPTYLALAGNLFSEGGLTARAEQFYREALKWGGENPAIRERLQGLEKAKKGRSGLFGRGG